MRREMPRTKSGYLMDEVASALQKTCRRSLTYQATFWGKELLRSGYGAYCWRRVLVIASEDVGPGDANTAERVSALHVAALAYIGSRTPKGDDWARAEIFLVHAIVEICRAEKSRMVAELAYLAERNYEGGERLTVPDYALDPHTERGRALGRRWGTRAGVDFWQGHSRTVVPERILDDDRWKARLDEYWASQRYPDDVGDDERGDG